MSSVPSSSGIANAARALLALRQGCPLPDGVNDPELFSQSVEACGLRLELVGLSAELSVSGRVETHVGSAADVGVSPIERAYFELVERLSIGKAIANGGELPLLSGDEVLLKMLPGEQVFPTSPEAERWRFAKSNGVALALSWSEACSRATAEAVERDCVLRSWYGEFPLGQLSSVAPSVAVSDELNAWEPLRTEFELELRLTPRLGHWVAVAGGFPRDPALPFCIAFGARQDPASALFAARREFTQRLGFLLGEALPQQEPAVSAGADYHQEYSLWTGAQAVLRSWFAAHEPQRPATSVNMAAPLTTAAPVGFVDLTPPELRGRVYVVRAWWPELQPLVFGVGYPGYPPGPPHPIA